MAQFPQGVTHVDARCNAGERRVLQQLRRCLEDDYIVWHNVPIGPRARQPDFVVLSPRWGVLLLEVKDWKRATLVGASPDAVELATPRGRVTEANPLRQARDVTMELVDLMQHDTALVHAGGPFKGKLLFPYGWGVVFSGLRRADVAGSDFHEVFGPHRVLLRDDLDDGVDPAEFQQRLWGMFTVHYPHTLTMPQRDRVRWHLFPEIRLQPLQGRLDLGDPGEPGDASGGAAGTAAAAKPLVLPDLLQVMDLQQEQIARGLGEGHRVIHGAAGSGKTMILIYRAQQLATAARPDRPILVLCYNRALADRIDAQLRQRGVDERVQVRTFHAWCQDLVRSYQLDVPGSASGDAYYEALARTVDRAVESGRVPGGQYAALLIDEAHDFEDAWLRLAARMVDPATNSLLVLYDDAQSIYQKKRRKFNFASVGIEARGRTSVLRLNYRNTAEVLALAVHCAHSLLDAPAATPHAGRPGTEGEALADDMVRLVQPASAGRRGPLPVFITARNGQDEATLVAERIAAAIGAGLPAGEIAVLCRARYLLRPLEQALGQRGIAYQSMNTPGFRRFDWRVQQVRLLTLHSAKGLEFSLCCIAGLQVLPMQDETLDEALRLLYVGMTRATHELVLSAHGAGAVVAKVRQALAQVGPMLA